MQKCLIVLGMHRSGTSAVTRGLQVLGVKLGNNLMPPIAGDNEKGFWEDIDINTLNNEMLHTIDIDWHYLVPIQPGDVEVLREKGYFLRAVELLHQKIDDKPVFGFKDPRVAKLFPFWKEVFSQCQVDINYVLTLRHPLSVVKSLTARNGFDARKSYLLWLGHAIVSLSGTVGEKCIIIDYDRLMQSPDFELKRIVKRFDLEIDPEEMQNYKNVFLDKKLRHTVHDLNDLLLDDACPPLVAEIYTELLAVASDKKEIDDLSLRKKVENWTDEFKRLKSILMLVDSLSIKNMAITQFAAARDRAVSTLTEKATERDAVFANYDQTLQTLNEQMVYRDEQIAALYHSTSWRITCPLRFVGQQIKRFQRVIGLAISAFRHGGGLKSTFKKAIHLYNREGWAGIRRGFSMVAASAFDRNGNAGWIPRYDKLTDESIAKMRDRIDNFVRKPLISVVMPAYNTKPEWLSEAIESVRKQIYPYWELCIADGGSGKETTDCLSHWQKLDERIKVIFLEENKGIAGNSTAAFALAQGDYIVLLDHDDYLSSDALMELALCINKEIEVDFIYSDKAVFSDETKAILAYHHLPGFSPDFLRACNYASHLNAFSRHIIENVGFIKQEYDGSQDYEFELRVIEKARKIVNIPKLLYFCRACQGSVALNPESKLYAYEAGRKAIEEHIKRIGYEGDVAFMRATYSYRIHYKIKGIPLVSIIIPNRDHRQDLQNCVDSIMKRSTYGNYEIIIAENNSEMEDTFAYYDKLRNVKVIKIIQHDWKDFNFSALNNYAVQFAAGEHILLLNNDTEVISPKWIEEMLAFSQREDVGAVGAKLYFADNRIQHAGLVIGLAGSIASHYHYGIERRYTGYMHRLIMPQNYCAVTGACLMVKKSLYHQVGGLDEVNFKIGLNDVDFCLKLREIGKINVWTPYAELYHYESLSRGLDTTPEKSARLKAESDYFREKWKSYFEQGDPYQ